MNDCHDFSYLPATSDFIARSLLRMPDGQDFTESVGQLQETLAQCGAEGHAILQCSLMSAFFPIFRKEAEQLGGTELTQLLSMVSGFEAMWNDILEYCCPSRDPDISESIFITQTIEMLYLSKSESETAWCWTELKRALLPPGHGCFLNGKPLAESIFAQYLADELSDSPNCSPQTLRALSLFRFLRAEQPIAQSLTLVASRHGQLFILTPHNVHQLSDHRDGPFLRQELDRLSRQLPLLDFLKLLSAMNNEEHPNNTVAEGVLNDLCEELQAMLGPMK